MRSSHTTFEKLTSIFGKAYSITADNAGVLAFNYPLGMRESPLASMGQVWFLYNNNLLGRWF